MKSSVKFLAIILLLTSLFTAALAMEDGVYRDKAPGYGGDVIVTVIIRDGQIESLTTENTGGEKSEYYLKAEEALQEAIIAANGLEGVDTVSSATGTSESILSAMQGILEQAAYTGRQNAAPNDIQDGADASVGSVKEPSLTPKPKETI